MSTKFKKIINFLPIRRTYVGELFLLFLFLAVGAGFLGHTLSQKNKVLEDDAQKITLNYKTIDAIDKIKNLPGDMVANQGTYLLTAQRLYLKKYKDNKKEFNETLDLLSQITAENPVETEQISVIQKRFRSFCSRLESGTQYYKMQLFHFEKTASKALATVRADQAAITAATQVMQDEERKTLERRFSSVEEQKQNYYHILFFGLAGMPEIIFIFSVVFLYANSRRTKAELSLREAEERHLRELEASNRELEDFSYIVSHDLKEPLRGLTTFSKYLLEDFKSNLDEDSKSKLVAIHDITQRMDKLLTTLLEYSRLGRTSLAVRETDLNQAVQSVVGLFAITLKEMNIEVVITKKLPAITCDFVRITEVFHNLIGNAVKYNDKLHNRIEVGYTEHHLKHPGERVFFVKDNGIGIQEQYLETIFKIFKRLHGRGAYGGGTGSGLTIAKQIINQHGGQIWAESAGIGKGTTFFFTIAAGQKEGPHPGLTPDAAPVGVKKSAKN